MENKTKNFYQQQTHQHQNQLSSCVLWKAQGTVPTKELNTQNHSIKASLSKEHRFDLLASVRVYTGVDTSI
jgi:hypothetical protein